MHDGTVNSGPQENTKLSFEFSRGEQRFLIHEFYSSRSGGGSERTSVLTVTNVRAEDSGNYVCVSQNRAGRAEANFTLQVKITSFHCGCSAVCDLQNL